MNLRARLFPVLVAACAAALALVSFLQYRSASRAAEASLRADTESRARRFARSFEAELRERAEDLRRLSHAPAWVEIYRSTSLSDRPEPPVTEAARSTVGAYLGSQRGALASLTFVYGTEARPLMRFEPSQAEPAGVRAVPGALLPSLVELGEQRLTSGPREPYSAWSRTGSLVVVAPVPLGADEPPGTFTTLVAELRPDAVAARAVAGVAGGGDDTSRQAFALDRAGRFVYHTNDALKFQTAQSSSPHLSALAAEMGAGRGGALSFDGADGARWLAAYEPVRGAEASVAVASNETAALGGPRLWGRAAVAASALLAALVVGLVLVRERRASGRIERVAQAALAVAAGDLDRRIETGEHDRIRAIAESFNLMTDRLREHLRRESENRQFQAFMRLSAMLTHDIKNAITGLSMLVANMERQFHREEFRADAVQSVRDATDKLRGIVARLSEPTRTLSGEYRTSLGAVNLADVARRVVETTAAPASPPHHVELELPDELIAQVDAERVERVVENLVINALEAMGTKPGTLTVSGGRAGDDKIFIAVADTGPGMSAEFVRNKLFRPFATTKQQGLGLGLYTCREVVEAHGGMIEVETEQGSGTRFRVVLPSRAVSLPRVLNSTDKPAV